MVEEVEIVVVVVSEEMEDSNEVVVVVMIVVSLLHPLNQKRGDNKSTNIRNFFRISHAPHFAKQAYSNHSSEFIVIH